MTTIVELDVGYPRRLRITECGEDLVIVACTGISLVTGQEYTDIMTCKCKRKTKHAVLTAAFDSLSPEIQEECVDKTRSYLAPRTEFAPCYKFDINVFDNPSTTSFGVIGHVRTYGAHWEHKHKFHFSYYLKSGKVRFSSTDIPAVFSLNGALFGRVHSYGRDTGKHEECDAISMLIYL